MASKTEKIPVVKRIRETKPKVEALLRNPQGGATYKDDDEKLVARYWIEEVKGITGKEPKVISMIEFLTIYGQGKITPADDITRARRQLQEKKEDLRGLTWNERHGKEQDVRKNISKPETETT